MMRSNVLLIWLFTSNHLRRPVVRLELTDFPMTKHGWVVLFIHAQPQACVLGYLTHLLVFTIITSSCRDFFITLIFSHCNQGLFA